ncbi:SAM-dependent DNA methyltransferase [Pseudidiomarina sp. 1APP75-32.1]|uniref:site-specific DNA-methyltransferase (adenine-specific) n=1 Tax=Pseudidiomarina terrestris TaxID=2820060 RepID=A0AAW7R1N0_9GAMM|nr:class I SAM-dependent DNA methyltransferase [Pseudidiomarina sp. 1APP75-32.1]MDN7125213.1 SAM-dependent DNA methyltransferase [Pseudidiomarina sp. 1APP75-32.1]
MAVTLNELEQHLWGAANILWGAVDSGTYKNYIFAVLFYKRLNDVWQEEYEQRLEEYGDEGLASDPDEHRFDLPEGNRWTDVRSHTTNIGEYLNAAFQGIEDANFKLRGIFQSVDFNNKDQFSDELIERLLQHFEKYDLRNSNVEADILGNAYEYLIKQFADDGGKRGGEFYTPKEVVRLMVECLEIDEGMSVYDPTCGSGGMLLEAYRSVERHGKNPRSLSLFGQERNLNTWAICQMNLFLHDIDDADVRRGDTLREPKHLVNDDSKALRSFDRVIANPPFSLKEWGHTQWKNGDAYGRDIYGCPPASYGDLAFVQHMLASLNQNGKLAVVVPHGVLFRAGTEGIIRQAMIDADIVEGVIGLAPNLFYGAGIPAAILLLNKSKSEHLKNKVMIVNGAETYEEGRAQNYLRDRHIETLSKAYSAFSDEERLSALVATSDIAANDYNLNITRYVNLGEAAEQIDVAMEVQSLLELTKARNEAEKRMMQHLKELGYVE